jgi:hypothetical protein
VCNYCHQIDALAKQFGTGLAQGDAAWKNIVQEIKRKGSRRKYDCIIGVSGGTDSSYLLLLAKKHGLRPLAVHYDNTWNSAQAAMNIRRVTTKLNIDLYTYVVNNNEVDDIKKSFLLAGVREFDADTDIAFVQVLRSTAAKFKIEYILEGHSFLAEGLSPVGDNYLDGGYVKDIQKIYGKYRPTTFPNLTFLRFMKWTLLFRQKFIRPLWYLSYSKEAAQAELAATTGWKDYGGHHLENRASAFAHKIYLPERFGIDYRFLALAAKVRSGLISRQDGIDSWNTPLAEDRELLEYVCSRLKINKAELQEIMSQPTRTWRDFRTYKRRFEILKPLFYILARQNRVPQSFYQKYCFREVKRV